MNVICTKIPEVKIIDPEIFRDRRGFFYESFSAERYHNLVGINRPFVQDNLSRSSKNILRGLHHQREQTQGKLVSVVHGKVFDVVVDIRKGSPTFKQWVGVELSDQNRRQLWVPPGFAHGFVVLTETADFAYKCTDYYHPESEISIKWDDPDISIEWPSAIDPKLSEKDLNAPSLIELLDRLPEYKGDT